MLWSHNSASSTSHSFPAFRRGWRVGPAQRAEVVGAALGLLVLSGDVPAQTGETADIETIVRQAQDYGRVYEGWRAVRQLDCARCHGSDYRGSFGPSLIAAIAERTADEFKRVTLEGNAQRGMPPYKSVKRAADNIDGIYAYFRGLADGSITPGVMAPPK